MHSLRQATRSNAPRNAVVVRKGGSRAAFIDGHAMQGNRLAATAQALFG